MSAVLPFSRREQFSGPHFPIRAGTSHLAFSMRHNIRPALCPAELSEEATARNVRASVEVTHQKEADMRYISLALFLMTTLIFQAPAAQAVPLRFVGHLNSAEENNPADTSTATGLAT